MNLPINVGHRGASAEAPENTMAAFRLAVDQGARMLEMDTRLTLDGYAVVIHDSDLDRTTDGRGKVEETLLADLRKLDAGSWFGSRFAGERIPLLTEVMEFARATRITLDVEMKFNRGPSSALCEAVGAIMQRLGFYDEAFVSSFNHDALTYLKSRFPRVHIARLYNTRAPSDGGLRFDPQPDVAVMHHLVVPSLVKRVHRHHGKIYVWTVDDAGEMQRMVRMGVDAIITNRPAVLQRVLEGEATAAQK